jgi:outer membrane receptor protein involved in Fe transport
MKKILIALFALSLSVFATAQRPGGGGPPASGAAPGAAAGGFNPAQMQVGRFYGKVVDDATGKPVEYASVQLNGMRWDSVSRSMKPAILGGQLTEGNGDFSIEKLPIMGDFTLKISCIGYETSEQTITFGFQRGGPNRPDPTKADKDLGNIRLKVNSTLLKEVDIKAEATGYALALDKRVFKVDKNLMAAGGTAEDALKTVPSLAVDLDGNLTLRNSAPQLFVDGRPTNLTLDQIPADVIDNVEVITNPSAKYDAGGGGSGIVNIVLKKDRRVGYNGNIRAGIDMRGRPNLGGDINARQGKINAFVGGNFNMRRSISEGETDRLNRFGGPNTEVLQVARNTNDRYFANVRTGLDWFINNRNTLTFAGNFNRGQFQPFDEIDITTDTLLGDGLLHRSLSRRTAETNRGWRNVGGQLLYKKLFPTEGRELTADVNYNGSRNGGDGTFVTDYFGAAPLGQQRNEAEGGNDFVTIQTDFVTPMGKGLKFETGVRAAIRNFRSINENFQLDPTTEAFVLVPGFADEYEFTDQVYAAYGTFQQSFPKWGYQAGLRAESSVYDGVLPRNNNATFGNRYPLSLFPSVFTTYKINEEDNLQVNYSRRINRPNFFQLMPFPDFSDSLQLSRGNPELLPEFTNSLELSYQNILNRNHNFLASVYYRRSNDLITRYQFTEFNADLDREVVVASYANSNSAYAYGFEFIMKNTLFKIVELTSNANFYNSVLDATNVEANLRNEQFTWFLKENLNVRLPKDFVLQVTGEYQSRTAYASSGTGFGGGGGGGRGGGGGGWMGGPTNSVQGYGIPYWFVDVSVRKNLLNRKASITLSVDDVFASRRNGSYAENVAFVQETWRLRDPQFFRLTFSYRFGKFDTALFKHRNTRVEAVEGF